MSKTKAKTRFFCQECGAESSQWMGKCNSCGAWNSYVEEVMDKTTANSTVRKKSANTSSKPILLQEVATHAVQRNITPDAEFNRVLGGGIVPGSIILIGGEPGIGKSTLMLQLALQMKGQTVVYISGEESEQQIRMRAERIGIGNETCYLYTETALDKIFNALESIQPSWIVLDSIQTLHSTIIDAPAGSVSQLRQCTAELQRYAKETDVPVFLIGHITKDGVIAGPKILEHIVDAVLQFEGDRHYSYRLLRTLKNRFGSTAEIGIYEMQTNGMRQVTNPSDLLITNNNDELSGISIAATMEGMRPLLIETQALVSKAVYGTPQRSTTGFDLRRLHMLLAVLEKRCGFYYGDKDVFINIAGGLKIEDPAIDLSIVCALLSSMLDIPLPPRVCFAGEVGLSGEVRTVARLEQRISEAEKLGFKEIIIAEGYKNAHENNRNIRIKEMKTVSDVYAYLFG
ncbi:MAG: DNA repair protein RadA [Chitinophagales bacterium]|nr:DNA repair protein RadA [Bacteroidota bacterium]